MGRMIVVGMADMNICKDPDTLTTIGLGSCVGVTLYDKVTHITGMVHVMLPYSTQMRENANRAKFADTGIVDLLNGMIRQGAKRTSIVAKMAGGASMFSFSTSSDTLKIGQRNAEACKAVLAKLSIRILAEDCGGTYGRTIEISSSDGILLVKTLGKGSKTM